MALAKPQELRVDENDLAPLYDAVDELSAALAGWINLVPEIEPGQEPPPRSFFAALMSARGDAVPLATWSAPEAAGRPATIGIQHGSGPRALTRLAEHDLAVPPGWIKRADHSRRGLVIEVPHDTPTDDVIWWLLSATHLLSVAPLTGSWLARVFRP